MRGPLAIAGRELRATFTSPFGYGLTAGFLALSGVLLVLALRAGEARLDGWFAPLFVLTGGLAALLSMRTFAEEERAGSLELLLTAPLHAWQVVAGKLMGVVGVFLVLVAATVTCPLLVAAMGDPDPGPILTGYLGLVLLGVAFLAVGVATSAATSSQLVSGAGAGALLLGLWFGGIAAGALTGRARTVLEYLSPSSHVTGFLRGTVATADVVYFCSLAALGVMTAVVLVRERR